MTLGVHYSSDKAVAQTLAYAAFFYAAAARENETTEELVVRDAYPRAASDPYCPLYLLQCRRSDGTLTHPGHPLLYHPRITRGP